MRHPHCYIRAYSRGAAAGALSSWLSESGVFVIPNRDTFVGKTGTSMQIPEKPGVATVGDHEPGVYVVNVNPGIGLPSAE